VTRCGLGTHKFTPCRIRRPADSGEPTSVRVSSFVVDQITRVTRPLISARFYFWYCVGEVEVLLVFDVRPLTGFCSKNVSSEKAACIRPSRTFSCEPEQAKHETEDWTNMEEPPQ